MLKPLADCVGKVSHGYRHVVGMVYHIKTDTRHEKCDRAVVLLYQSDDVAVKGFFREE